jgi:hypothetical protein
LALEDCAALNDPPVPPLEKKVLVLTKMSKNPPPV